LEFVKNEKSLLTTRILVRSIRTVFFTITKQAAFDTVAVTAGQGPICAQGLVGDQKRLDLALLVLEFTIFHRFFPIAGLLFNIKVQTGRATDGLQTLKSEGKQEKQQPRNVLI
jgi:hypothetical protein